MPRICLAPLAGVNIVTVREFFTELGADFTHTEMISCEGLARNNPKTFEMLQISEFESPLIIQVFAQNDDVLTRGVESLLRFLDTSANHEKFFGLGINMACPMPKVTKNGSGAALLRKPDIAVKMVESVRKFGIPVWVKIRKLENSRDTLELVGKILSAGASNICIHGRTQAQRYSGIADKKIILEAVRNFGGEKISASGDVWLIDDVEEYVSYGCECVMIARGAIANPWLFCEIRGVEKSRAEKLADILRLAERTKNLLGEHKAVVTLKKFSLSLMRGFEGGADLRDKICKCREYDESVKILRGEN